MGYSVNLFGAKIFIDSKDAMTALTALNEGCAPELHYGVIMAGRWGFEADKNGNIIRIEFNGEKGRDDSELKPLAPFVRDGSFVEMSGEDGARWRWAFKGGKVIVKDAKMTW